MLKIIKQRRFRKANGHRLIFRCVDYAKGGRYSWPCDEAGNVDVDKLCEAAQENYRGCVAGELRGFAVLPPEIQSFEQKWIEDAEGRCECGRIVVLSGFTNECECGRDYSRSGQELAPRSQWGLETGEALGDILAIR